MKHNLLETQNGDPRQRFHLDSVSKNTAAVLGVLQKCVCESFQPSKDSHQLIYDIIYRISRHCMNALARATMVMDFDNNKVVEKNDFLQEGCGFTQTRPYVCLFVCLCLCVCVCVGVCVCVCV